METDSVKLMKKKTKMMRNEEDVFHAGIPLPYTSPYKDPFQQYKQRTGVDQISIRDNIIR